MLQDISRGAPTEIEAINGAIAKFAVEVGVDVPVIETLRGLVQGLVSAGRRSV
jgi:ketopantoate reductase